MAGINFDHMHMGYLLRMVHDHPQAEIVGICDRLPARMHDAAEKFGRRSASSPTSAAASSKPALRGADEGRVQILPGAARP